MPIAEQQVFVRLLRPRWLRSQRHASAAQGGAELPKAAADGRARRGDAAAAQGAQEVLLQGLRLAAALVVLLRDLPLGVPKLIRGNAPSSSLSLQMRLPWPRADLQGDGHTLWLLHTLSEGMELGGGLGANPGRGRPPCGRNPLAHLWHAAMWCLVRAHHDDDKTG